MIRSFTAGVALSGLAAAAASAGISHIDLFEDGPFFVEGGDTVTVTGDESSILGGARRVGVDLVQASASLQPGDDAITFNSAGIVAATLTLEYGAFPGGDPLDADFTPWNFIAVEFGEVSGGGNLSVAIDGGGGSGSSSQSFINGPGVYYFSLAQPGLGVVDLSDVDGVTIELTGATGSDFEIASITLTQVPAPTGAAVFGLAALALTRRRR